MSAQGWTKNGQPQEPEPSRYATARVYMHLIEGRPARFDARRLELFWASGHGRNPISLCGSLAELKAQQEAVREYRTSRGWPTMEFGYACVRAAIVGPDDQQTDCVGEASTVLPSGNGEGATHAGGESGLPHHEPARREAAT